MSSLPGRGGCIKFKTQLPVNFTSVKTPKNRVSSAKGVHLAEILLPVTKIERYTRCVLCGKGRCLKIQQSLSSLISSLDKGWAWNQLLIWFDPAPVLSAVMLPPPIYPISYESESPTMFSIGFVSVGFRTCLKFWTSIIFKEIPCENS
jgi:hypothetical protein